MTENMENEEELKIIRTVEKGIFSKLNIGFDWSELDILNDPDTPKRRIAELGTKIAAHNPELSVAIFAIANSVYFGHNPLGKSPDFFDAVIRLGADRIKIMIFALTLFSLGKGPEARLRAAKSASISILGRMIADAMNLKDDLVRKIEAGGLLSQLGNSVLMKAREMGMPVSDAIIVKYQQRVAITIIEKLKLDPFLKRAVDLSTVEFDEESFSLVGIIKLAEALTEDSFRRYGKLVLRSPLPGKTDAMATTPGDTIIKLFSALGISEHVMVINETGQNQ